MPVLWTLWNFQETKMTSWLKNIYLIRNHHYNSNIFLKKYIEICKTNKKKTLETFFNMHFLFMVCSCCSVSQLCLTLCSPMDNCMPGFPVLHYLLEFAQTHVHWVDDDIQPSHPLSPPFSSCLNLSQHQGLFHSVSSLHQVASLFLLYFKETETV